MIRIVRGAVIHHLPDSDYDFHQLNDGPWCPCIPDIEAFVEETISFIGYELKHHDLEVRRAGRTFHA